MRAWLVAVPSLLALGSVLLADEEPTYHNRIQPMLATKCVVCHQEGGPSPFPLSSFADVKKRATLLRWVCISRTMPPTDAATDFDPMCGGALSDDELIALQEWVRTGAKEGKPEKPAAIPPPLWRLSSVDKLLKPDAAGIIEAEGRPYRKMYIIDPKVERETSIVGFDLRPVTPLALRQAYVAVLGPDESAERTFPATGISTGRLLGSWAFGYNAWTSPNGLRIKPGERLAVYALYQPSGKPENAGFELGLKFAAPATPEPEWLTLGSKTFEIPPADGPLTIASETTLEKACRVTSIVPECRLYAQQVKVYATLPNGQTKRLLSILTWDRNWPGAYQPKAPISLPAGTKIKAEITYDNTGHSQGNREARPTTSIRFGTDDASELFWVHIQSIPRVP